MKPTARALPTIADLAAEVSGIDWPGLIAERFGAWAAGYFDEGQALWAAPRGRGAYAAWRAVATHDLTPEIVGLGGFATRVSDAPESAPDAVAGAVSRIALPAEALETYFHQMLMTLGGWAQYARYRLWQAELGRGADATITDFLAIRLIWEAALLDRYEDKIAARWKAVIASHSTPVTPTADHVVDAILQEASERAAQRALADTLAAPGSVATGATSAPGRVLYRCPIRGVPAGAGIGQSKYSDAGVRRLLRPDSLTSALCLRRSGTAAACLAESRPYLLLGQVGERCSRSVCAVQGPRQAGLGSVQAGRRVVLRLRRGDGTNLCRQACGRCFRIA
uniref:DUF2309 family protein n=1 Tax=Phenylobacterium glaciei TaxID=2803784 RepID=A0A974P685_9CAUL|nr:DUF2309 family protein [Phenylobacterium glaciei]